MIKVEGSGSEAGAAGMIILALVRSLDFALSTMGDTGES